MQYLSKNYGNKNEYEYNCRGAKINIKYNVKIMYTIVAVFILNIIFSVKII